MKKKADDIPVVPQEAEPTIGSELSTELAGNIEIFEGLFTDVDIMLSRRFCNAKNPVLRFCIFYSDGVTDSMLINEHIIKPLILSETFQSGETLFEQVRDHIVMANDLKESTHVKEIVESITYGDTLLLIEGSDRALILSSKSFSLRGISEPEGEKVLSGPREGFTEGIMTNLSMVRRRLRTHQLKLRFQKIGRQSSTTICVAYMDNIVNKKLLKELYRRLDMIDIDAVLDANYITEYIAEKSFLGFNTIGDTERPDVVVAKLLEGRIALFVDGSPVVLTAPYLFIENFQSNEDYYMHPIYVTYNRLLRMLCFVCTIIIPGAYIAAVAFHQEMIPLSFMLEIASERHTVPLPAAMECFIMLVIFDILRETGVRMPNHVGQALSVVGALVIGQAAVAARLVAAPMIIVVAFAGITILLIPRLTTTSLLARYLCLILASMMGFFGLMVGMSILLIHAINLRTFGIPYMTATESMRYQDVKDVYFRAPWPKMLTRLSPMSYNRTRTKKIEPPSPPAEWE